MADPIPSFYENNDTDVLHPGNVIAFGSVSKGSIYEPTDGEKRPIHLWNDKGGGSADTMETVQIGAKSVAGGDVASFIQGTALNGNVPVTEVRSNGAAHFGSTPISDDAQASYTPVGGLTYLSIGDIPANAYRSLDFRVNLPADFPSGANELDGKLVVEYTFTS